MGFFDRILKIFGVKKDGAKIVCVGLDNSGKTTLLNKMKKPKEQQVCNFFL
jgi:ADP-ribosylation factor-like protein 6